MIDPRDIPLPITWLAETPDTATLLTVADDRLYARCGEHVVALEAAIGAIVWTVELGKRPDSQQR